MMMNWLRVARLRLRTLLDRGAVEEELDEELRFHLEMQTQVNLQSGMSPREARRQAMISFGGAERYKEEVREARGLGFVEDLVRDLRYAIRQLVREPGFTIPMVVTLALGIGVTTAMFSVVDATLLRPLPFEDEHRLVLLDQVDVQAYAGFPKSYPDLSDLDSLHSIFSQVAAYAPGGMNLTGMGEPMRAAVTLVTPSFFSTLGLQPQLGRAFTTEEGKAENAQVAILSEGLWRRRFGGDMGVIGRTIELNDASHIVVGIMPRGYSFPGETEVWLPYPIPMPSSSWRAFQTFRMPQVIARLAPGATQAQAETRLSALRSGYRQSDQPNFSSSAQVVHSLRDSLVQNRRTALLILMGAAALMLLIACTNAANLLLSRAARRRREIALRTVLGATSGRIVKQLLAESVLLALISAALGVAVAYASTGALTALVPKNLLGMALPTVDVRVLLFATTVALATGLAVGIWPALQARRLDAGATIKAGGSAGVTALEGKRLRQLFVLSEFSLTIVLLVGAGIMLRSLQAVLATDPGVKPERVATVELSLTGARYGSEPLRRQFYEKVLSRLHAAPEVEAAAAVNDLPLRGGPEMGLLVHAEGKPPEPGEQLTYAQYLSATPDYFAALGIPLLRGRPAAAAPDSAREQEVVVNVELARKLWPGEDPIGKRLAQPDVAPRTVVGVVGNVRAGALDNNHLTPQMYLPFEEQPEASATLVVRGSARPDLLVTRLREALREVDPDQAVYNASSMEQVIAGAIAPRRTTTLLVSLFGLFALTLVAIGIYGVISSGVVNRRAEIGIRLALGARSDTVVRMVVYEGLKLAIVGAAIGMSAAWFLSRTLEGLVYGVSAKDPVTFGIVPVVLILVALIGAYLPARMAARVDPLESLRAN